MSKPPAQKSKSFAPTGAKSFRGGRTGTPGKAASAKSNAWEASPGGFGGKLKPTKLSANAFSPRTPKQVEAKRALEENDLIFLVGPAGTAKTTLAAAQAVEDLLSGKAETLILSRAAVEAGDSIGFLPGDVRAKMELYCMPMLDALALFLSKNTVDMLLDQGTIQMIPMTYLRGKSIPNAVIIIDEFQNATPHQGKLVLTRSGDNTRLIITADPEQIDLPDNARSAASDIEIFEGIPGIEIVDFSAEDVTRSVLCGKVLKAYDRAYKQAA